MNFSFEDGVENFDETYIDDFDLIPGWRKGGDGDSGIETGWVNATHGDWICYHEAGDNYIHQTLDLLIQPGKTYILTYNALSIDDEGAEAQVLLRYGSQTLANTRIPLSDGWAEYSLSFNSDEFPSAVGQKLRILFRNVGEDETYAGFDNFRLDVIGSDVTTMTVSVDERRDLGISNKKLNLYPNPVLTNSNLNIEASGFDKIARYEIYHINGQLIFKNELFGKNNLFTANLDPGIYLIKAGDKKGFITKTFIITD